MSKLGVQRVGPGGAERFFFSFGHRGQRGALQVGETTWVARGYANGAGGTRVVVREMGLSPPRGAHVVCADLLPLSLDRETSRRRRRRPLPSFGPPGRSFSRPQASTMFFADARRGRGAGRPPLRVCLVCWALSPYRPGGHVRTLFCARACSGAGPVTGNDPFFVMVAFPDGRFPPPCASAEVPPLLVVFPRPPARAVACLFFPSARKSLVLCPES